MKPVEVKRPGPEELESLGVRSWDTWSCDASTFDWEYGAQEVCYFLEGEVTVDTLQGQVRLGPGDLAVFPRGLKCTWRVAAPVRKHYRFE